MSPGPNPKSPRTPPQPLVRVPRDVVTYTDTLWRIHRTRGEHVLPWNMLRSNGPLPSMRWDPHRGSQPAGHDEGVLYAAADIATGLAELYQTTRIIDTQAGEPVLTGWRPQRELRLLDLSDTWLLRNGASAALLAAPRATCRRWASAIYSSWPDIDGLFAPSTMTGRPNIVLWTSAADSFPAMPAFSRPLAHPLVWSIAQDAAHAIGYRIS